MKLKHGTRTKYPLPSRCRRTRSGRYNPWQALSGKDTETPRRRSHTCSHLCCLQLSLVHLRLVPVLAIDTVCLYCMAPALGSWAVHLRKFLTGPAPPPRSPSRVAAGVSGRRFRLSLELRYTQPCSVITTTTGEQAHQPMPECPVRIRSIVFGTTGRCWFDVGLFGELATVSTTDERSARFANLGVPPPPAGSISRHEWV